MALINTLAQSSVCRGTDRPACAGAGSRNRPAFRQSFCGRSLAIGLKSFLPARPATPAGRESCRVASPSTGGESFVDDTFELHVCMAPVLIIGGLFMACLLFVAFMGAGCAYNGNVTVYAGWRSAQSGSNATNRVSSGADLELPLVGGK